MYELFFIDGPFDPHGSPCKSAAEGREEDVITFLKLISEVPKP